MAWEQYRSQKHIQDMKNAATDAAFLKCLNTGSGWCVTIRAQAYGLLEGNPKNLTPNTSIVIAIVAIVVVAGILTITLVITAHESFTKLVR